MKTEKDCGGSDSRFSLGSHARFALARKTRRRAVLTNRPVPAFVVRCSLAAIVAVGVAATGTRRAGAATRAARGRPDLRGQRRVGSGERSARIHRFAWPCSVDRIGAGCVAVGRRRTGGAAALFPSAAAGGGRAACRADVAVVPVRTCHEQRSAEDERHGPGTQGSAQHLDASLRECGLQ
jgi:hypothetical protein